MNTPIEILKRWLDEEAKLGSPYPQGAILATTDKDMIPYSRVVEIKEINAQGAIFFTQKKSRKVAQLYIHSQASLTFWFPLSKRQVNWQGQAQELSLEETQVYWNKIPRQFQIKYSAYAPITGQVISDEYVLKERYKKLEADYQNREIPLSEEYLGYRVAPHCISYYELKTCEEFSKIKQFILVNGKWQTRQISP